MSEASETEIVHQITIGDFRITRFDSSSVWISAPSGEGGQFSDELFEQAIRDFYNKYF